VHKISFGNKDYVKASEIAKRFKYTQDYVGQLCRGKKVDARLVGRTWYVEPSSVTDYRKTKHTALKTTSTKVAISKRPERNTSPKPVQSVVRAKTLKTTKQPAFRYDHQLIAPKYSADRATAIPIVQRPPVKPPPTVAAAPVPTPTPEAAPPAPKKPAKKIKIKKSGLRATKFLSEKTPEIALSGKLTLSDNFDEIRVDDSPAPQPQPSPVSTQQPKAAHQAASVGNHQQPQPAIETNQPEPISDTAHTNTADSTARVATGIPNWLLLLMLLGSLGSGVFILSLASVVDTDTAASGSLLIDFDTLQSLRE